ncbi:MAG: dynamin family protein [Lachnospiraceae bacterium]|nr:dynamin family protein [Lachnospiraceae bacterium]
MLLRTNFDEAIHTLEEINGHYENEGIRNAVNLILQARDEYELKILVVGHFNAGKSSLINSFIERPEFLEVDLGETTALASELRYSEEEKAFSFDKKMKKEAFVSGRKYLPSEYDHISYYLKANGLKEIEDFVIVDTPGFDTAREDHTRALASYLGYGVGFIMVVDVQKGGIDSQILNYLYEISEYSENIVILVNKCDKRIDSEVAEVVESIEFILDQHGFDYPVYSISKYDDKVIEKVSGIINGIDAQEEYDAAIKDIVSANAKNILEILRVVSENRFLDTYEYDEIIRIQERKKELAKKSFETKRREMGENVDDDVEVVIEKVKSALRTRSDEAARAIENRSTEGLQAIILDTIRPVLIESVKEFSVEKITEISKSFQADFSNVSKEEERGLDEIVMDIAAKVQGLIQSGAFLTDGAGREGALEEQDSDKKKSENGGNAIYKLVTAALSIVTGGTVTWVEAIIVLLPEILAGLKCLFGESNHSKLIKQYEEMVIPQITNSLWPAIKESFENNIETMITIFETEMGNSIDSITQLIDDAKSKKARSEEEYEAFKKMIAGDIERIENMMEAYND